MDLTKTKRKRPGRKRFSYKDYVKLPDDGKRYEILNGDLKMSPLPITYHQEVVSNVFYELIFFIKKEESGRIFIAPYDVVLDEFNIVQPDIIYVSKENNNIITEKNIKGSPDLVIEILSPSSAYVDLVEKKEIYEKFKISEYWIIDPQKQWLEIFSLKGSKYTSSVKIDRKGKIKSSTLNKFNIDISRFFEGL